jgi:hypothetical protein
MAEFTPPAITENEVQVTEEGMKITMTLPAKTFSTGKNGFFKQGMLTTSDGKKYRINFQAYEAVEKK